AVAAYCPQKSLEAWDCYNCKGFAQQTTEVVYLNNNEFESGGFLGVNSAQRMIVISFKGTKNFKNWLSNLQFKLTDFPVADGEGIQVHSGFNEAADAIYPQVRLAVLNAIRKYPGYQLVSTGHSLGGAMATLLAFKVAQEGIIRWENIKIVTFGQPRIGNKAFADYLNSKPLSIARVTTKGDFISISPGFQFGYHHSQYNMHMDVSG
ncbi:alpha/beta-hydrolase, partial [Conidiobolus coronatus NRRL 28638]